MRLPRMRVRTLMIAVTMVAVVLAPVTMGQRSMAYRAEAEIHLANATRLYAQLHQTKRLVASRNDPFQAHLRKSFDEELRLQKKYSHAAAYPWLPVEPDPPPPK